MSLQHLTYSREDILRFDGNKTLEFEIINKDILQCISKTHQAFNGLYNHRTKRGCRAGKRYKKRTKLQQQASAITTNQQITSSHTARSKHQYLPTVLYTNCRSLNQWKLEELAIYSEIHAPQIICLTETWLDATKEAARQIQGYKSYYCHRKNRIGGGVGILACETLTTKLLDSHTTSTFSAIWILIKKEKCAPLIIGCVYHPPNSSEAETLDYMSKTVIKLTHKHPKAKLLLAGDFNRLAIDNFCAQNHLANLVDFNTREGAKLDLLLTDIQEYEKAVELSPISNNDHCCILLNGVRCRSRKYKHIKKRMITQERKHSVYRDIALETWQSVYDAKDVHDKAKEFHQIVDSILDRHCPKRTVKCRVDQPPWITSSIIKLINARESARKKKCKSYKFLSALIQRKIRSAKRGYVNNELNNNQNTKEWWNTLNHLTNKAKQSVAPDKLLINGGFLSSDEFAAGINDYYVSVGGPAIIDNEFSDVPHQENSPNGFSDEPHQENSPNGNSDVPHLENSPIEPISIGEVKILLKKLDTTKATSTEDYPTWVSVECAEDLCIPVHHIVNCMLSSRKYPDIWKRAQIAPQPKCTSPTEYKQYRPISLLFHIGKLAEEVVIRKMRHKLDAVIKPTQYAYKAGVSTTDALLQYVDDYTKFLDDAKTKFVQSACLDFSKAFDRLQPSIVVNKMRSLNFDENIVRLISNFLCNRTQCVKFSGSFSDYKSIEVGSPQGTKLGPVLWLIYVNDLECDGFSSLKYADDTTFYKPCSLNSDPQSISEAIENAIRWSNDNSMLLNSDKTVLMNTSLSHTNNFDEDILVNDVMIPPSDQTKFLGVIVDNKLNFSSHIEYLVSKCNSRLFLMRQLKSFGLNSDGLKTFYISNIRSILLYGAPAWHSLLSLSSKEKLESIQRSATRIITPDMCHKDRLDFLSIPLLNDFIFSSCAKHFERISSNQLHPLFSRINFNNLKRSSRAKSVCSTYRPEISRTQKRSKSFFQYYMRFFNNGNIYVE